MDISIDGVAVKLITIKKRVETFTMHAAAKPSRLEIDPHDKIILKTVKITPLVVTR